MEGRGATVVALSGDSIEAARELATKLELGFPVLSDGERTAMQAFGVEDPANQTAWPALFVLGPGGRVIKRSLLETYKERPLPEEILAVLGGEGEGAPAAH